MEGVVTDMRLNQNGSIVLDESGAEIEVTATHALIETFQLGDATFRIRKS